MMLINIYLMYFALLLLSLVLKKHYKEIIADKINIYLKVILVFLGVIILSFSLTMFIKIMGLSLGITYYIGCLGINIIFIAMLYAYCSKVILKLTVILFILTLLLTIL